MTASEKDLWNRLFRNVPIGAYRMAPDGHLLCANPALLAIHGCAAFEEIAGWDTDAARASLLHLLEKEGGVQGLEHSWSRQDGARVLVRENVAAVRGDDGQLLYYEGTVESISDRVRSEPSAESSSEILNSFYESVPQMIGVVELTNPANGEGEDILHIADNAFSAGAFGLKSPEEMRGRRSSELGVSPVTIRRWRDHYLQSAQTGKPVRFEYVHQLSPEAESLWYSVTVQHIKGNRFCYIVSDITEQSQQESYLRLLEAAVEDANDVVMIMEAESERESEPKVLYVNSALERMTGYTSRETVGRAPRLLQDAGICDEIRQRIRGDMAAGIPIRTEIPHSGKDGTTVWIDLHVSPVVDAGDQVTHLVAILRDVTERRKVDQALQASEQRLQTILNNLPVIVFVTNQEGVFTFLQGKGLRSLGLKSEPMIGKSFREIHREEPDVIRKMEMVLEGDEVSWLYTRQKATFEMQCRPLRGEDGKPGGLIGVAVDVTERRQLREKILQSEKLATIGEFVTGIAHQINNPLAAISGIAQLLALHPEPQVQEDAKAVRTMADRATRIVQSLITFAGQNVNDNSQWDVYSLNTLLTDGLALFWSRQQSVDERREISVEESRDLSETLVKADRNQMLQVIVNLLDNADRALQEQTQGRLIIVLRGGSKGGGDWAWFSITDTGVGMPEAVRQRIFEPFFTTREFGAGSGLGLSLCHGIVEAHRGNLLVETQEGKGTIVTVRLPLYTAEKTG